MKTYETELKDKWSKIDYHEGGSLQLAIEHPLTWFVRYATEDHKSIVIVTDSPADKILSSKSIDASCNKRKDGKYAISFTLVNKEQEDVFISMASDIIEFSKNEETSKNALSLVLRRYAAWLNLLDHKRSAFLSINDQQGLLAELIFLKEEIQRGRQPSDAVAGWVGPEGASQDFDYENCWYEIKSTSVSSSQVTISSVEQLDNSSKGELVVLRIDKCAPGHNGAITLYAMVHSLFDMMASNVSALDNFTQKLGSVGYIDVPDYKKQHFSVSDMLSYSVDDKFPRIRKNDLPEQIVNAEYQLDLPSLAPWAN